VDCRGIGRDRVPDCNLSPNSVCATDSLFSRQFFCKRLAPIVMIAPSSVKMKAYLIEIYGEVQIFTGNTRNNL